MIFCIHKNMEEWYELIDPEITGTRVEPQSHHPSSLLMMAKKVSDNDVYRTTPQQSDYANEWENLSSKGETLDRLHFWRGSKEPTSPTSVQRTISALKKSVKAVINKTLGVIGLAKASTAPDNSSFNLYKRR